MILTCPEPPLWLTWAGLKSLNVMNSQEREFHGTVQTHKVPSCLLTWLLVFMEKIFHGMVLNSLKQTVLGWSARSTFFRSIETPIASHCYSFDLDTRKVNWNGLGLPRVALAFDRGQLQFWWRGKPLSRSLGRDRCRSRIIFFCDCSLHGDLSSRDPSRSRNVYHRKRHRCHRHRIDAPCIGLTHWQWRGFYNIIQFSVKRHCFGFQS